MESDRPVDLAAGAASVVALFSGFRLCESIWRINPESRGADLVDTDTVYDPGLYWHNRDGQPTLVAQVFYVSSLISDPEVYYELEFVPRYMYNDRSADHTARTLVLSARRLAERGQPALADAAAAGLQVYDPRLFTRYLTMLVVARRRVGQIQAGWSPARDCYWWQGTRIGADSTVLVSGLPALTPTGSQAGMTELLERLGEQSLGMLAVAAALAGPTLDLPIGLHLYGESSSGKSTLLYVASSVWGSRVHTWNSSPIALERLAAQHNDSALCLDEVQTTKQVAATLMHLMSGTNAARATREGRLREQFNWRCVVVSSGEQSLDAIARLYDEQLPVGLRGRLLEIECQRRHGVWDCPTNGCANGAQTSDYIRELAKSNTGWLGPAYVRALLSAPEVLDDARVRAQQVLASDESGIVQRARRGLMLMLAAALSARVFNLVPWSEEQLCVAFRELADAWVSEHGRELQQASRVVRVVREALASYPERFPFEGEQARGQVWGWRMEVAGYDGVVYAVYPRALRQLVQGVNFREALGALRDAGMLLARQEGRETTVVHRKSLGGHVRVYLLSWGVETEE